MDYKTEEKLSVFADEMFKYLLARRVYAAEIPISVLEKREFSVEIGKAIMITLRHWQPQLHIKLKKDSPQFVANKEDFMRYAATQSFDFFDETKDDVFDSFLRISAFVLEIIAFCVDCGIEEYTTLAPMCWCEIFNHLLSKAFYTKGGWNTLSQYALPLSLEYDKKKMEYDLGDGKVIYDLSWLSYVEDANGLRPDMQKERLKNRTTESEATNDKNMPFSAKKSERKSTGDTSRGFILPENISFRSVELEYFPIVIENYIDVQVKPVLRTKSDKQNRQELENETLSVNAALLNSAEIENQQLNFQETESANENEDKLSNTKAMDSCEQIDASSNKESISGSCINDKTTNYTQNEEENIVTAIGKPNIENEKPE